MRKVLALPCAVLIALVAASPAAAHTGLLRSAPGASHVVGGEVARVELEFDQPLRADAPFNRSVLRGPDGADLPTTVEVDKNVVRIRFQPLTTSGDYQLYWWLVNETDGHAEMNKMEFHYSPQAPAPDWFTDNGDSSMLGIVVVVVVSVAVALLGLVLTRRVRQEDSISADGEEPAE